MVLIALFELNTPEFTMLLGALPKTFQDGTTKLLHNHLRSTSASMVTPAHTHLCSSPATVTMPTNTPAVFWFSQASPSNSSGRAPPPPRQQGSRSSPLTSPTNCSHGGLSPRYAATPHV